LCQKAPAPRATISGRQSVSRELGKGDFVMVEANSRLKLLSTSILDIYKMF